MANYSQNLDQVFSALGDPTRRAIVERLVASAASISELATPFDMALPSFLKHVQVLERAGLIRSRKQGRVRTCMLDRSALQQSCKWLVEQRAMWESRTDRMAEYVEQLQQQRKRT